MRCRDGAAAVVAACAILGAAAALGAQATVQDAAAATAATAASTAPQDAGASGQVPKSLAAYAQDQLSQLASSPEIVRYIEALDARRVRVADLKALDAQWQAAPGVEGYMWNLMRNPLAWELVDFQYQHKFVMDAFAMDMHGAIVAETNRTSGYYKGDADTFSAAYANGTGALRYGPAGFDESTAEMVIQVSVPVMKGSRAIGVICFSVSLDRWEDRRLDK